MIETPLDNYKEESVKRVADLTLDEQGEATGTVKLTYLGDPALHWRQEALKGDDTSLNLDLRSNLERMLPGGMEVRVTNVTGLSKPDQPLVVDYSVKGAVGTPTGKRLLITGNLFEVNAKPVFPDSKREQAVYMHHPSFVQDAVRFKLPATMTVESAPKEDAAIVPGSIGFTASSKQSGSSITMFRNVTIAKHIFLTKEYPDLRGFYGKLETRDQEPLVLIHPAPGSASAATAAGPGN